MTGACPICDAPTTAACIHLRRLLDAIDTLPRRQPTPTDSSEETNR